MDFNHQTVSPNGGRGLGQWFDKASDAGGMAGINNHRQVALGSDNWNRADVQGVQCVSFIGADAALAQNDIPVALGNDVLCRIEPFINSRREPAF